MRRGQEGGVPLADAGEGDKRRGADTIVRGRFTARIELAVNEEG